MIIQPLEALFVWTERLVLFDFLCVCLSTEAPTRWKPCWRTEAKTDSRRTVQSMYWISDWGSSKCEWPQKKNTCSLRFQSCYLHIFMLWIDFLKNSLGILMERMMSSSPIFVRCLKPNHVKVPGKFDETYIQGQVCVAVNQNVIVE